MMRSTPRTYAAAVMALAMTALCACGGGRDAGDREREMADSVAGVLVELDGEQLTEGEVALLMPRGLGGEDSLEARHDIIRNWLTDRLLQQAAREGLPESDRERIERMVDDYRRALTVDLWKRRMADTHDDRVPEDSVRRWYASHPAETTARRPLAKGVIIKLPSNSPRLEQARRWVAECSEESIDRLESETLDEARGYDYFGDRWVDLGDLAEQVPGMGADLESLQQWPADLETTAGGWTCLVHLSERIGVGERLPYEYAAPGIADRLERATARSRLIDLTVRQARKSAREKRLRVLPGAEEALPFRLIPRG